MSVPGAAEPALARGGIDRSAAERDRPGLLPSLRADASTRVLRVSGDRVPLSADGRLDLVRPAEVSDADLWAFLGRDGDGAGVLAAIAHPDDDLVVPAGGSWAPLRAVGGDLAPRDAGLAVEAVSLGRWLRGAPFCSGCGSATEIAQAGWSRRCPGCGRTHFPRTDPAVIVAVTSADGDRLLLGANAAWPAGRYSCFAGFVEAGESLEAAVQREVVEEAGVEVADVRYRASQSWPYPRSIMLGFHAAARADGVARADGEEIVEIRWFSRAEIGAALAGESGAALPGPASIAHRLILDWYEAGG